MRRPLALATLSLFALLLSACGESAQLTEVRSYVEKVQPIAIAFSSQASEFADSMSDAAGMQRLRGSLQTTITSLKAVNVSDPALADSHAELVTAHEKLKEAVDMLSAVIANPAAATPDFQEKISALIAEAGEHAQEFETKLTALIPEDERTDANHD